MPEKKKTIAKKSTTKKLVKKSALKKAPKKSVPKIKKTTVRKKKTATVKSTIDSKKPIKKDPATTLEEVKLPSNASLRSKDKAKAINENLDTYIAFCVHKIAIVSAACFLLVGSTLAVTNVFSPSVNQLQAEASLASLSATQVMSGDTTEGSTQYPAIEFIPLDFPSVITTEDVFRFTARNIQEVEVNLSGPPINTQSLSVVNVSGDTHSVTVQTDELVSGEYRLKFSLFSPDPEKSPIYRYHSFVVEKPEPVTGVCGQSSVINSCEIGTFRDVEDNMLMHRWSCDGLNNGVDTACAKLKTSGDDQTTEPTEQEILNQDDPSLPETSEQVESTTTETIVGDTETEEESPGQIIVGTSGAQSTTEEIEDQIDETVKRQMSETNESTNSEPEADRREESIEKVTEPVEAASKNEGELVPNITVSKGRSWDNYQEIIINAPLSLSFIEIYARPANGFRKQFVTLGSNKTGRWIANVNKSNLPQGDYILLAESMYMDKRIQSKGFLLTITKKTTELLETVEVSGGDSESNSSTNEEDGRENAVPERDFVEILPRDDSSDFTSDETDKLIRNKEDDINKLFRDYAVAVQSGDSTSLNEIEKNIEELRNVILREAIEDNQLRTRLESVEAELQKKLQEIKEKVQIFENLRKEKSDGKTAVDTDGDGISDFDEVNLYKTNPNSPDTDQDGVNDNVEITGGFDPNNPASEAVIEFKSPKDSLALVRDDVLIVERIDSISPATQTSPDPIKAEIRGRALPNSFVTLYIFSNPTVVTIETDTDGSFVYTFEKELEDGQHEVYVAVTDNVGSIVAQSNPFIFIKEAEAFTEVLANQDDITPPVVNTEVVNPQSNSGLIVGMSIISFGLILLLLGLGIRTKEDEFEVQIKVNEKIDDKSGLPA
jgi:hypothetical protein